MPTPGTTFRCLRIASWLVAGLAVVAALYFARTLFIPVTLAAIIALVLAPVVRVLCRLGFPRSAASGLVVVAAIGVVAATLARLSVPAAEWFSRVPLAMAHLRYTFREVGTAVQADRKSTRLNPRH